CEGRACRALPVRPQLGAQRGRPRAPRSPRPGSGPGAVRRLRAGRDDQPAVAQILKERGLDPSREVPQALTDTLAREADVIVTMACGDACPAYPGKRYVDWDLPDPAGQPVERVRPIVEDIDRRVRALLAEPSGAPR